MKKMKKWKMNKVMNEWCLTGTGGGADVLLRSAAAPTRVPIGQGQTGDPAASRLGAPASRRQNRRSGAQDAAAAARTPAHRRQPQLGEQRRRTAARAQQHRPQRRRHLPTPQRQRNGVGAVARRQFAVQWGAVHVGQARTGRPQRRRRRRARTAPPFGRRRARRRVGRVGRRRRRRRGRGLRRSSAASAHFTQGAHALRFQVYHLTIYLSR